VGLPVAVGALWYGARQLSLARKASSAAVVIPLGDSFRECWLAFIGATNNNDRRFHFAELVNALETACAIFRDKVLYGASREVLEQYLVNVFQIIETNQEALELLGGLLESPKTFENIVRFLESHRKQLETARKMLARRGS